MSFCIFFKIGSFFSLDTSASTFKWLVKDAEEYKNITSFRRKCRLVYNRLQIKLRTYAPGQDGKKGIEFMLLPETTKTKIKTKQNSYIFETMVFNTLNTRKQKIVILERQKANQMNLWLPPAYCFDRVSRLHCKERRRRWSPVDFMSWRDKAESLGISWPVRVLKIVCEWRKQHRERTPDIFRRSSFSVQPCTDQRINERKVPRKRIIQMD